MTCRPQGFHSPDFIFLFFRCEKSLRNPEKLLVPRSRGPRSSYSKEITLYKCGMVALLLATTCAVFVLALLLLTKQQVLTYDDASG